MLDEAMLELDEKDRRVILLRFFQSVRFSDLGRSLGLSEDAARMRVERALDKLHARLTRRGIASTAGALALALSNQAIVGAPAGLANAVASVATASVAGGTAIGLLAMTTKSMLLTTVAVVATGSAIYEFTEHRQASGALVIAQLERDTFRARAFSAEQRALQADKDLGSLQSAVEAARTANAATEARIDQLVKGDRSRAAPTPARALDPLVRLSQPVTPPANLDPRYAPAALKDKFVQVSREVGLGVRVAWVDDSEFPFIVYGQAEGKLDGLKTALRTTPGYTHDGSVSGQGRGGWTYFAMSITPMEVLSDSAERDAARGRIVARLKLLAQKAQAE